MINRKYSPHIKYPASVHRPIGVLLPTEEGADFSWDRKVVKFPNYTGDLKVTRESVYNHYPLPAGSYEVDGVVVLLLEGESSIIEVSFEVNEEQELEGAFIGNVRCRRVSTDRFLVVEVSGKGRVAGVFLRLRNGARVWASGIVNSSPLVIERYSQGRVRKITVRNTDTGVVRLGLKADFIDVFREMESVNSSEEITSIRSRLDGDIVNLGDSGFVNYVFGIPFTKAPSPLCIYNIEHFCRAVKRDLVDTKYWVGARKACFTAPSYFCVPENFWEGRNRFLTAYGFTGSLVTITDFHYWYWDYIKARNGGRVFMEELTDGWPSFRDGGGGVSCLNILQLASIYTTYHLGLPVNYFPSLISFLTGNFLGIFIDYIKKCPLFLLTWIDFNNVSGDPNRSSFVFICPENTGVFTAFLNIGIAATAIHEMPIYKMTAFRPFGWKHTNFPDPYSCIKFEDEDEDREPMYTEYEIPEVVGLMNLRPYHLVEVVVHEIGCAVDVYGKYVVGMPFSNTEEWRSIAGWEAGVPYQSSVAIIAKENYTNSLGGGRETPISSYGCVHTSEDFAETYRVYIINPTFLRDMFPKRFEFMEKHIKYLKPMEGRFSCEAKDHCTRWESWACR